MTEDKTPKVVEKQEETSFTWAWIILIILILLLIGLNFFLKFIDWEYVIGFLMAVGILSTVVYIVLKYSHKDSLEGKQIVNEGVEIVTNPIGKEYILHYAEYEGIIGDFDNSEVFECVSLKAGEKKESFDTNVSMLVINDNVTNDDYWMFMNAVENKAFLKLEKFKKRKPFHRKDERYIKLLKQLDIKIEKNPSDPETTKKEIVNSYAQKSTMNSIIKKDSEGNITEQVLFHGGKKEVVEEEEQ